MADTVAEWRMRLQPWLSVLRTFGLSVDLPPLPTVSDINELWLSTFAPPHTQDQADTWMMIAEALELLELLARVDHRAAWTLLFEVAREERVMEQYGDYLFASPELLPRFLIHVEDDGLLLLGEPTIFGLLRFVVKASVVSADYNEVKQTLLDQYALNHDGVALDREAHGRVQVAFSFDVAMDYDDEAAVRYLFKQIDDLLFSNNDPSAIFAAVGPESDLEDDEDGVEEHEATGAEGNAVADEGNDAAAGATDGEAQATRHRERAPFELDSYRICLLSSIDAVPSLALKLINHGSKSGLPLTHVYTTNVMRSELHPSVIGDFMINQIVPWAGGRVARGIRDLKLSLGKFDVAAVRAFCSAIVCSHSLRRFAFDQSFGGGEDHIVAGLHVWWPWLAYALFSRDATHNIHSVLLNVRGVRSMSIVNAVREVLDSDDPANRLYRPAEAAEANAEDSPPSPMAATFQPTANLRLGHHSAWINAPALTIGEPGATYRVLRNVPDEDFIEFLIPGYGVAWTERSQLIELQPVPRRAVHTIRHLTLKFMQEEDLQTTIALLQLIGEPLERVSIIRSFTTTAFLDGVLRCCPKLKRLDLTSASFQSFGWLCSPNNASPLKLETLTINYYTARAPLDWSPLFNTLSDPTHPLTRSLRELSIVSKSIDNDTTQDAHDEIVRQYVDMLSNNVRLTRCEMTTHLKPTLDKYKAQFHSHHLELVVVKEAPLPIPQALAFLSTGMESQDQQCAAELNTKRSKAPTGSTTTSARHSLGPEALRSILEFAAIPKRRLCKMEHRSDRLLGEDADMEDAVEVVEANA